MTQPDSDLRDRIAEAFARYDWNVAPVFRSVTPNADHYSVADAVLAELPALACEADQAAREAHPPYHRWYVETRDGVADQWAPGMRFTDRAKAVERYQALSENHPTWYDGTPVERRIVRETTTYSVEEPAAVARPGQPETGTTPPA
jgi:hypothetical protein